jgi:prepilin-type N-terminal cleavage/methylation domain-containing protein/prepilin-type processing-associated H-X9-DG protein
MTSPHKSRGFTLIELLVALAIIGILVSLLGPALASAQMRARQTSCLSDFRQWGFAFQMYADGHDNFLPRENGTNKVNPPSVIAATESSDVWYNALPPELTKLRAADYMNSANWQDGFYSSSALFSCPSARFDPALKSRDPLFSRGMNAALAKGSNKLRLSDFHDNGRTLVFLEAGVPGEKHGLNQASYDGRPHVKFDRSSLRHLGRGNAAFMDGHAEAIGSALTNKDAVTIRWGVPL